MDIIALKFNKGFYIKDNIVSYNSSQLEKLYFDGVLPGKTFKNDWFVINKEPKIIEKEVSQPNINFRFELIEPELFKELKQVYKKDDVVVEEPNSENNYKYLYTTEFEKIHSLYKLVSDKQENIKEPVEFTFNIIGEVDEIKEPKQFSYPVYRTKWKHEGITQITNKDLSRKLIDEISTPSILHPVTYCELTSKQVYDITRYHIQQNINPKVAKITSDYDFCFSVSKVIKLAEEESYKVDVNNNIFQRRRRKPKYETKFIRTRDVKIFEMTHSEANYTGYIPIEKITGENEDDLNDKLVKFLAEVVNKINEPLVECPHCKGIGVILDI